VPVDAAELESMTALLEPGEQFQAAFRIGVQAVP
jgi:hypothetical protein